MQNTLAASHSSGNVKFSLNQPSHRRRRFRDHLSLHPDRRSFRPTRFILLPADLPQLSSMGIKVYLILSRHANNQTQRCFLYQETIAAKLDCDVRTVRRGIAELLRLDLIAVLKTRLGNVYTMLNAPSERTEMSSGKEGTKLNADTGVNTPVSSTSANAPVPRAREGASIFTPAAGSPDEPPAPAKPPIPAPAPAKPALQPRRRWNGRSQSVIRQLTPVQKAAEGVMAALGVALSLWRTREAIAHAIRLWAQQNPGQGLEEASAALVACRRGYEAMEMRFYWGHWSFFGEGHWQKRSSWPVDRRAEREAHLAREARAGSIEAYSRASSEPEGEWPIRWN